MLLEGGGMGVGWKNDEGEESQIGCRCRGCRRCREGAERRYMLGQSCAYTTNALYRLGFKWPVSGERYIAQMIKALDELIMFEE